MVPYFVPNFVEDEAVEASTKRFPICFFGSSTNSVRRRAIKALSRVPGAMLSMTAFTSFNSDARQTERARTLATRAKLRQCKFCLVPAGITPSSRRFYEALVAVHARDELAPTQVLLHLHSSVRTRRVVHGAAFAGAARECAPLRRASSWCRPPPPRRRSSHPLAASAQRHQLQAAGGAAGHSHPLGARSEALRCVVRRRSTRPRAPRRPRPPLALSC